jgi:hypothetical protein
LLCVSTAQNEILAFAFFIVTGKSNFYGSVATILFCNAILLRIAGLIFSAALLFDRHLVACLVLSCLKNYWR